MAFFKSMDELANTPGTMLPGTIVPIPLEVPRFHRIMIGRCAPNSCDNRLGQLMRRITLQQEPMKEEDDANDADAGLFPLTIDDLKKLTGVIKLVREQLSEMNPACLRAAASVLLALERLPSTTPGVQVTFSF